MINKKYSDLFVNKRKLKESYPIRKRNVVILQKIIKKKIFHLVKFPVVRKIKWIISKDIYTLGSIDWRSGLEQRTWDIIGKFTEPNLLIKFPKFTKKTSLNPFLQIKPSEPEHSSILANLLSPLGSHNMGVLFLSLFFEVNKIIFDPSEKWEVSAEKERYDIRIRNQNNTSIVIIENKSNWATDQPNQLYRYWYYGIFIPQYNFRKSSIKTFSKIIYLSPSDYKEPSLNSVRRPDDFDKKLPEKIPIDVDLMFFNVDVVKWLELCLNKLNPGSPTYYYVESYLDFWRR